MKKLIVFTCVFQFMIGLDAQTFNTKLAAKLQEKLDELMISNPNTKGMSAGVYVPGQGPWYGTGGSSHNNVPITSSMKMGLASNSKLFTSVVMLLLAEKNIINLDDKLSKWLPKYNNIDENATIRQLLNHSSGIEDMTTTQAQLDSIHKNPLRAWKPEEVLSWIGPMKFIPGTGSYYSNTNYILAGMIAEKASGKKITKLIREYILDPYGLNHTFYDIEETIQGIIAHRWYKSVDYNDTSTISLHTAVGPAGSIYSTPEDMLKWYQQLLDGSILSPNSLNQLTQFTSPSNYGLGITKMTLFNKALWGHGGITVGYKTRMFYDPCMKVITCGLSNSNPSAVDGITGTLYKVLLDYLPTCAGNISGISKVCQGQNAISYSVAPIANATSYFWTLPNGYIGSSSTNSITINFDYSAVSGSIKVQGENEYGRGNASSLNIVVNQAPVAKISTIGSTNLCPGETVILQSDDATSYKWSNGATTKTISVSAGGDYSLIVTNTEGCKSIPDHAIITAIYKPQQSAPIQGQAIEVCPNSSNIYSVPSINDVQYYWVMTTGASIQNGQGSPTVQVNFNENFIGGKIGVILYNKCGNSPIRYLEISSIPILSGTINGNQFANCQSNSSYRIQKANHSTSYTWSTDIPGANITIVSNSSDTEVVVQFPEFISGNIFVKANNACGSSSTKQLKVFGVPSKPVKIFGNLSPCSGTIQYYYISKIPGATSYLWTVPSGTTILNSPNTNIIKVIIGNNGGEVGVAGVNNCGVGEIKLLQIPVPCQPTPSNAYYSPDIKIESYPNPASDWIKIKINSLTTGKGIITIKDMNGRTFIENSTTYSTGTNEFEINLDGVPSGLYYIVFSSKEIVRSKIFAKQEYNSNNKN